MANIISIGTAVPLHKHKQEDILRFMQQAYALEEKEQRKLAFLYHHSGIQSRYSVLPDYSVASSERSFLPRSVAATYPDIERRQNVYDREALPLAVAAIEDCFRDGDDATDVTHLITVSCTGMSAPGLDLALVSALGLSPGVVRTSVNFMGCYAAIHAMKMAGWICQANPNAQVLIVCVELCTLHFQREYSTDNATSSLLFADGAAAVLLSGNSNKRQPQLQLRNFYSWVDTRGKNDMTWSLSSQGFRMTLSNYVPHLLETDILPIVEKALEEIGATAGDVTHWCIHPGGKRILEVIGKQLQISRDELSDAYGILAQYGNMSSATILFVLKQMMANMQASHSKALVFGAAFGPGLTVETFSAALI